MISSHIVERALQEAPEIRALLDRAVTAYVKWVEIESVRMEWEVEGWRKEHSSLPAPATDAVPSIKTELARLEGELDLYVAEGNVSAEWVQARILKLLESL